MLLNLIKTTSLSSVLRKLHHGVPCRKLTLLGSNLSYQRVLNSSYRSAGTLINKRSYSLGVRRDSPVQQSLADVNTNVANNVVLWRYDTSHYHAYLNIFGLVQFITCVVVSVCTYNQIPDREEGETLKEYFLKSFMFIITVVGSLVAGFGALIIIYLYTVRSIKYLILHKGGKAVTIETYHLFKNWAVKSVPIEDITIARGRMEKKQYLPVKIRNHFLYHVMSGDGVFVNPDLFDHTIGIRRDLEKK